VAPQSVTLPALTIPAAPDASSVKSGSGATSGSGSTSTTTPAQPTGPGTEPGDDGNHRTSDIKAPTEACQVPGSANGLTDVTAPLAKVFCTN
jgi:hypothetical protein